MSSGGTKYVTLPAGHDATPVGSVAPPGFGEAGPPPAPTTPPTPNPEAPPAEGS